MSFRDPEASLNSTAAPSGQPMSWTAAAVEFSSVPYADSCGLPSASFSPLHDCYLVLAKDPAQKAGSASPSGVTSPLTATPTSAAAARAASAPAEKRGKPARGLLVAAAPLPTLPQEIASLADRRGRTVRHSVSQDPVAIESNRRARRISTWAEQMAGNKNDPQVVSLLRQVALKHEPHDYYCPSCRRQYELAQAAKEHFICRSCYRCPCCTTLASFTSVPRPDKSQDLLLTCSHCGWRSETRTSVLELQNFLSSATGKNELTAWRRSIQQSLRPILQVLPTAGSATGLSASQAMESGKRGPQTARSMPTPRENMRGELVSPCIVFDNALAAAVSRTQKKYLDCVQDAPLLSEVAQLPYKPPVAAGYAVATAGDSRPTPEAVARSRCEYGRSPFAQFLAQRAIIASRLTAEGSLTSPVQPRPATPPAKTAPPSQLIFANGLISRSRVVAVKQDVCQGPPLQAPTPLTLARMGSVSPAAAAAAAEWSIPNKDLFVPAPPTDESDKTKKFVAFKTPMVHGPASSYRAHRFLPVLTQAWQLQLQQQPNTPQKKPAGGDVVYFFLTNRSPVPVTILDVQVHHYRLPGNLQARLFAATHCGSPKKGVDPEKEPQGADAEAPPSPTRVASPIRQGSFAGPSRGGLNLVSSANGITLTVFSSKSGLPSYLDAAAVAKLEKSVGALQQESRLVFGITVAPPSVSQPGSPRNTSVTGAAVGELSRTGSLVLSSPMSPGEGSTTEGPWFVVIQISLRIAVPVDSTKHPMAEGGKAGSSASLTAPSRVVSEPTEITYFSKVSLQDAALSKTQSDLPAAAETR